MEERYRYFKATCNGFQHFSSFSNSFLKKQYTITFSSVNTIIMASNLYPISSNQGKVHHSNSRTPLIFWFLKLKVLITNTLIRLSPFEVWIEALKMLEMLLHCFNLKIIRWRKCLLDYLYQTAFFLKLSPRRKLFTIFSPSTITRCSTIKRSAK